MELMDINLDLHLTIMPVTETMEMCRDRYGWFNVTFFHLWACSQCFSYLFPDLSNELMIPSTRASALMGMEATMIPPETVLYPDLFEGGAVKDRQLCEFLGQEKCQRLTSCCGAAIQCCSNQAQGLNQTRYSIIQDDLKYCPRTWDGFACFRETAPGKTATISCPAYFDENTDNGIVEKLCTENGTWATHPINGQEWTDYSTCVSLKGYRILYYVCVGCHAISLVCLVPACIIFIRFRQLRKQHRIRIHINLCVSFILTSSAWLGWDHLIFKDRLENAEDDAFMYRQTVQEACKILYVISRYSLTCNCCWMSLEGFHLHRLINHAFNPPKSISSYYFVGWLIPLLPIGIYSVVRLFQFDKGCWVTNANNLEWIMYGPIILCILVNVGFLTNILRILLTQIQCHPNEPSNYRRALKATFILAPLFGLQVFLIVYQPHGDVMSYFTYEIFARIISNSQGTAVATIFCFLNSEVHGQFRSHVSWTRTRHSANENRSFTYSSEMRRASTKEGRVENIQLKCSTFCHGSTNGSSSTRQCSPTGLPSKSQQGQANDKRAKGHML